VHRVGWVVGLSQSIKRPNLRHSVHKSLLLCNPRPKSLHFTLKFSIPSILPFVILISIKLSKARKRKGSIFLWFSLHFFDEDDDESFLLFRLKKRVGREGGRFSCTPFSFLPECRIRWLRNRPIAARCTCTRRWRHFYYWISTFLSTPRHFFFFFLLADLILFIYFYLFLIDWLVDVFVVHPSWPSISVLGRERQQQQQSKSQRCWSIEMKNKIK
jgi:hypothetical protein